MISSDNVLENLDIFLFHTSLFITINLHNPKLQTKKKYGFRTIIMRQKSRSLKWACHDMRSMEPEEGK